MSERPGVLSGIGRTPLVRRTRLLDHSAAAAWVKLEAANPTGSSLALVCSLKGYPLRIVTSDAFAEAKLQTMRTLGARLDVIASPGNYSDLIPRLQQRAKEIVAEVDGFATDQFYNRDALDGYR